MIKVMNKEEILFQKRMQDLATAAYNKGFMMFTDFLSMNEISLLHQMAGDFAGVSYELYGGYEFAERQMAMFAPDALFPFMSATNSAAESLDAENPKRTAKQANYPISLLKIEPAHKKFTESLSHRDYLGSLIGLGVERGKIGDIIVKEDAAYVYCEEKISSFFLSELTRVRHTFVKVLPCGMDDELHIEPQFREQKGTVASLRADAVVAMTYKLSRSQCISLFQGQKVFVNGRLTESNSHVLKEGDVVSVRGHGKFIFEEALSVTKKERIFILVKMYGMQ